MHAMCLRNALQIDKAWRTCGLGAGDMHGEELELIGVGGLDAPAHVVSEDPHGHSAAGASVKHPAASLVPWPPPPVSLELLAQLLSPC